ncbi:hypothetical protein FNH22_14035 [Fulvivirga sp. M361]|uniref:hypothetical protein n=1 Tax=Fulvivirga sp. M361 TaxID=2594266 RepID=UPI00117BA1E3|nr:hypothetical protein [Fulvivirga sp. M361]TRX58458.1 hypothetical protein FNH22_14035 [Fulvivirga sp. M361]
MAKKGAMESMIGSLTKAEKRYFRLFSELQQGDKKYLELFNILEARMNGSDKDLRQLNCADISVTKNYLGKLILKSLKGYNEGKTKRSELLHLLLEIEILFHKELYDPCLDRIKKAEKIALKYENYTMLLELFGWKKRLLSALHATSAHAKIKEVMSREQQTLEKLNNLDQYNRLLYEVMDQDFSDRKSMLDYFDHPLLQDNSCAKSFGALTIYYHLIYMLHIVTSNPVNGQKALDALIETMESVPFRIEEDPSAYVTALNNSMGMMLYNKEAGAAVEVLKKIRTIPERYHLKQKQYTLKIFIKTYNVELELYRDLKDWDKARALMSEIQRFLDIHIIPTNYLLSFYYQFAYIHFQCKEYSLSLTGINRIINDNFGTDRMDLQTYARFLFLMIHFELGNITLLKYAVENTRRFLRKRRSKLFAFESVLLKFFSQLSTSLPYEYKERFEKLSSALFQGHSEKQRSNILDYLDFESWINAKLLKG